MTDDRAVVQRQGKDCGQHRRAEDLHEEISQHVFGKRSQDHQHKMTRNRTEAPAHPWHDQAEAEERDGAGQHQCNLRANQGGDEARQRLG